jgi:hypothetical protein
MLITEFDNTDYKLLGDDSQALKTLQAVVIRYMNHQNIDSSFYYTDAEINYILENFEGLTDKVIAENLGRTKNAISLFRKNHELGKMPRWSKAEKSALESLFNEGVTDEEIAAKLRKTLDSVHGERLRMKLIRKEAGERWTDDEKAVFAKMIRVGGSYNEIGEVLGKEQRVMDSYASRYGLAGENAYQWTDEEFQYVSEIFRISSDEEIAVDLDRPEWQITRKRIQNRLWKSEEVILLQKSIGLRFDSASQLKLVAHLHENAKYSFSEISEFLGIDQTSARKKFVAYKEGKENMRSGVLTDFQKIVFLEWVQAPSGEKMSWEDLSETLNMPLSRIDSLVRKFKNDGEV